MTNNRKPSHIRTLGRANRYVKRNSGEYISPRQIRQLDAARRLIHIGLHNIARFDAYLAAKAAPAKCAKVNPNQKFFVKLLDGAYLCNFDLVWLEQYGDDPSCWSDNAGKARTYTREQVESMRSCIEGFQGPFVIESAGTL